MKSHLRLFAAFALVIGFCFAVFAQSPTPVSEPASIEQAAGIIPTAIEAFSQGKVLLGCMLLVLIVVFAVKQYVLPKLNVSTSVLPWLSVGLGILSALAVGITGGATAGQAALALLSGPAASSLWDMILKHLVPQPKAG
jgi:hypothetical protein